MIRTAAARRQCEVMIRRLGRGSWMVGNRIGLGSFLGRLTALQELIGNKRRFLTILGPFRPARVLAPEGPLWQEPAASWGGHLGRFPSHTGHAAVAQW